MWVCDVRKAESSSSVVSMMTKVVVILPSSEIVLSIREVAGNAQQMHVVSPHPCWPRLCSSWLRNLRGLAEMTAPRPLYL